MQTASHYYSWGISQPPAEQCVQAEAAGASGNTLLGFNNAERKAAHATRETELLTRWQTCPSTLPGTHLGGTQSTRSGRDRRSKNIRHFKVLRKLTL